MRYLPHTSTVPGVASAGLVSLIGVLLFVPNALWLVSGSGSTPGTVLAAVGTLLSTVLVLGGYLLLRDETTATHVPRIAGWAVLGTVLLGLIVVLIDLTGVGIPLFAGATLLSVSTFAHVIIGVRDVQRIRAEELAQQREKLAVLNRLVRHNLRHEAQYLLGAKSMLTSADAPDERETISADVGEVAEQLTEMHDTLERTQQIIRRGSRSNSEVDLGEAAARVVSEYRQAHPEATITVDVPGGLTVSAGPELGNVIEELLENAVVYTEGSPEIGVTAGRTNGGVRLTVTDNGPGIPEPDRSVITREADIDQMTHAQGLGLWFVRWAMDAYGGGFSLETGEDGTIVSLEFDRA
jgi:signal transduction histidine kinase